MPAQSTITSDDKSKIKTSLPQPQYKILTASLARVYYAYPDPGSWSYAGMQGALVLVRDNNIAGFALKMVDLAGTRGVVWEHELYEPFEYNQDRPFFHSFAGDVSLATDCSPPGDANVIISVVMYDWPSICR